MCTLEIALSLAHGSVWGLQAPNSLNGSKVGGSQLTGFLVIIFLKIATKAGSLYTRTHRSLGWVPIFMSLSKLNRAFIYPGKCEEIDTTFQRLCLELIDS